jgi:hypothetical protein
MKKLFVAVLLGVLGAGGAGLSAAQAWDGCGVGCHATWFGGGCVVDGWETATPIGRNECPAGVQPRPNCPYGYVWRNRYHACFAAK